MRRRAPATSLLVVALLAAGCTSARSGSPTTVTTQPSSPVFSDTGTAVVAVSSLPANFNPSTPAGGNRVTQEVMEQVWPQAFVTNARGSQTLQPGFVESAEAVSVSPLTIAYTLNPAAKWSDGVPITAADFIYNWHQQLVYASLLPAAGLLAGYRDIARITSSRSGHTVTVTFVQPFAEWESLFSNLVPAHIGERYGWTRAFQSFDPTKVISGGPFEITSVTPGRELVLSRNPSYWGIKPSLSHIVLKVMSTSAALAGLKTGAVSVAETGGGAQDTNLLADAASTGRALTREDSTLPTLWQLCLNMTSPMLQLSAFRLGLENSLYLAQVSSDSAGLSDWTLGPNFDRFAPSQEAVSGQQRMEPWNPTAALGYFTSLGFVQGSDGYLRMGGVGPPTTLSLLIPTGNAVVREAADVIQSELQVDGIRIVIRQAPLAEMLARELPKGSYELAIAPFLLTPFTAGAAAVYSSPVLPASAASSSVPASAPTAAPAGVSWSAPTPVGTEPGAALGGVVTRDVFGLTDPVVTRGIKAALTNLNTVQAATALNMADTAMWQDVPTIPLFRQPIAVVHQANLMNVSESPTWAGVFWSAQDWAIQLSPPIPPPTFPGVTPPTTSITSTGVTAALKTRGASSRPPEISMAFDARVGAAR